MSVKKLYLTAVLTVLMAVIGRASSNVSETPVHAAWVDKLSKFDFIFVTSNRSSLAHLTKANEIYTNSSVFCSENQACLFQNGNLINAYKLQEQEQHSKIKKFIFNSTLNSSIINNTVSECSKNLVSVNRFCTTHWNPPIHITGDGCSHTIEWHSPLNCPKESTNYEHPCYVFDSNGKLIDLTPLIRSDGSSYNVETGNNTVSKFSLNICNEAHEPCGPNVAACYETRHDSIESGHNNLTTLAFNTTDKTTVLTLFGQYNNSCPQNRLRTVVNFYCKNDTKSSTTPSLVKFTPCESTIEWRTIHACPLSDIQVSATECSINNDAMKLKIDLRQITGGGGIFKVPGIIIDGKENTMMIGLCRGIKSDELKCEGKASSMNSACLMNSELKNETQIIASISKAFIKLTDNRVHLEATSINKDCQIPMGRNFSVTKKVGTRVEFFCSSFNYSEPAFVAYEDCTYIFEWGTSTLCFKDSNRSISDDPSLVHELSDSGTEIESKNKNRSSVDVDKGNFHDATRIIDPVNEKLGIKDSKSSERADVKTTPSSLKPTEEKTLDPLKDTINKQEKALGSSEAKPVKAGKMNFVHKLFMIGLIVMSMVGFIVTMFILDRKTQLRIQLGSIRRQARNVLQPQQVPYSRVNSLDL